MGPDPDIDKNSLCYESAFKALEIVVKEASLVPLPDVGDGNNRMINTYKKDEFEKSSLIDSPQSIADETPRIPLPNDEGNDQNGVTKEEEDVHENMKDKPTNSILIIDGLAEEGVDAKEVKLSHHASPLHKLYAVNDSLTTTTPFIPFESFLKLGESQSMESFGSQSIGKDKKYTTTTGNKISIGDDDCSTTIPGESFLNLGVSMMVNDNMIQSKDEDDKDNINGDNRLLRENVTIVNSQTRMSHISRNKVDNVDVSTTEEMQCSNEPNSIKYDHRNDNEKLKEVYSLQSDDTAFPCVPTTLSLPCVPTTLSFQSRQNRNKRKKKKKNQRYYPSSSLFVSRQFLSR